MDLEEVLAKVVELGREELSIVRKRAEEKTAARDHGRDFEEMLRAADQLDHHAHRCAGFMTASSPSTGVARARKMWRAAAPNWQPVRSRQKRRQWLPDGRIRSCHDFSVM